MKKPHFFSFWSLFFWCFWRNLFWNALVPQISAPFPWKVSGCAPAFRHYSFCKMIHLKCLTVFWIRLCIDNCSVICTMTLCYVLGIYRHIQPYSALLRHIYAYWDIIKAYSCLFSSLCNPRIFRTLPYSAL